jgi:hypothetical protein
VLSPLAEHGLHLAARTATLTYILAVGATKAKLSGPATVSDALSAA